MPEIYNNLHPYYSPGDGKYQGPSMMHQLIFGEGLDQSFPTQLIILTKHQSEWFHLCADYANRQNTDYFQDIVALGEFIRSHMVDDVFISQRQVEYHFQEGEYTKPWNPQWEDFFKVDTEGKLIRLPVKCVINYISIRFRNEVDKTQFQLINDGQYQFMDELETDRLLKAKDRYHDHAHDILCPLCKVNYNENKKNTEDET